MKAPAFWWRSAAEGPARLLAPLGAFIGRLAARRMDEPGARAAVPVVCIGNPVAGGAGKTPTALFVAARLREMGRAPVFLSRGYGGRLAGPVLVDPKRHRAADVGDEPLLLAEAGPTVVARSRVAGSDLAASVGDVVVMDDGFQNPSLAKDLSLLVVDGAVGTGNGLVIPAGPLRAPLALQLARAQALLVIGAGEAGARCAQEAAAAGLPVLHGRLVPDSTVAATLRGRRAIGFAGIGRPAKFKATLLEIGAELVAFQPLGDHAVPSARMARELLEAAQREQAVLVTTAKDAKRLARSQGDLGTLRERARVLPITLQVEDVAALDALLARALSPQGV